jgi:hypothetical protein
LAHTRGLTTPAAIEEALAGAGFVQIRVVAEREELYFTDEEEWWRFEWSHGNRSGLERLAPTGLAQRKQESFEWMRQLKGERGIPMWMEMLLTRARKSTGSD